MKNLYLFLLITFSTLSTQGQNQPFITTWEVDASDLSITIPTHSGSTYNYTVDFGDGTVLTNQTGDTTHTYNSAGTYIVSISGTFPRIYFNNNGINRYKVKSIDQWGDISWESMASAFKGCFNLMVNATDAPDLTLVTDLSYMFSNCNNMNQSINHWDISNITNISYMFFVAKSFNQPLNGWNVGNVTNMTGMFGNTNDFNQPLNNWDVSNVTNMRGMFSNAIGFNQNINNWDVSNVSNMMAMFSLATLFDKPLNNWNVSNVSNMSQMFQGSTLFNQPLNSWNVSSATIMHSMFENATSFNQPLNNWNVSNAIGMSRMFADAINFNQNIHNWNVSNVLYMSEIFKGAISYNQPLNNWNVSNVINMDQMFDGAILFNHPLNNWDVSNVSSMVGMFANATSFNQNIDNWDVSNVTAMGSRYEFLINSPYGGMFQNATSFNHPLNNWDVSNVTDFGCMFNNATSFNQPLNNWIVTNSDRMEAMFAFASSFNQDISSWVFSQNVSFDNDHLYPSTPGFIKYSNLDNVNYDKFLASLVSQNLPSRDLEADGLEYCNFHSRHNLINNLGWDITGDIQSQNCNFIMGNVTYDENSNGCDPNDAGISGFMVSANNGTDDIFTYSNNGDYQLGTIGTNFTVSVMNYPSYFSVTPASQNVTFTTSNTEVADFCVTANQTMEDLNVVLIPISEARPGFEADYQLVVENIGTQTLANATVTLDFDDTMQSFVNASVTPTSTTANQLTFDMANLQPLTFQTVDITMQTFQPPTVNGDDILSFTANVSPSMNDFTPNDNTFVYDQTVVNSYDPNDKQVLQGEEIEIDNADEYLNYLIRFQNTGTASAINVRILDTLHPKLDYSTLRPVNASHNYRIEVTNENEVEFIFDGINLPDENTNEPASHGFVAYKIKPKSDVAIGDFITGDANIYFDFNAPIITNMVSTEIIDDLSFTNYELENNISIYPNPTQNTLHIEVKNNQEIEQIKIYNLSGLELMNVEENKQLLNLESLSAGVYFINIQTNLGTVNRRFIKS
ncbi:BspA family leucine-rich repeat surface protein [Mesonia sp. K4-1]|uniref:BspA family leucine-rich repeat surface protein n=1 Tax=Mesonia sp. K4-1 TaxID=2602760 RepID=UPI0011CA4B65|nr:BspA family leucine-rich repeat surface protein [Mesonia sp. K4-1]TXK78822.1 BspA family leucine-rich repeat surface protein [Mesonia sp. K4-1]